MQTENTEIDYNKVLSFGLKFFHSFKIIQKGIYFDVIPFSANVLKGWNVIKEVV